jgi:hypothetical protein
MMLEYRVLVNSACVLYIVRYRKKEGADYITRLQRNVVSSLIGVSTNPPLMLYVEKKEQNVKTKLFVIRSLRKKEKCVIETQSEIEKSPKTEGYERVRYFLIR